MIPLGAAPSPTEARYPSLRDGLLGLWSPSATGPTDDELLDLSGYGRDGSTVNMEDEDDWILTEHGWALEFLGAGGGANEYVDAGGWSFPAGPCTMSVWVKADTTSNGYLCGVQNSGNDGARILRVQSGKWQFECIGDAIDDANGSSIPTGTWVNLCAVKDDDDEEIRLCEDGEETAAVSIAGVTYTAELTNFKIGNRPDAPSTSNDFDGSIAEVAVWGRALKPQEVRQLVTIRPGGLAQRAQTLMAWLSQPAAPATGSPWFFQNQILKRRRSC